tara:strand:- start:496 stop:1953 length:1458 start_codon:yes stop_codon:yes gene_type:complete
MNISILRIIFVLSIFVTSFALGNVKDVAFNEITNSETSNYNQPENNKPSKIKETKTEQKITIVQNADTNLANPVKKSDGKQETKTQSSKNIQDVNNDPDQKDTKNNEETKKINSMNLIKCENFIGQENCILQITKGENVFAWNGRTILISELFNQENIVINEMNTSSNIEINQTSIWHEDKRLNLWTVWNSSQAKNLPPLNYFEHNNQYIILSNQDYKLKIMTPDLKIPKSLKNKRVVAYYGYPEEPLLGILGELNQKELIQRINNDVNNLQIRSPDKDVLGALHIIVAVAQDKSTDDGTYLERIPNKLLEEYIDFAEKNNLLVFLDIQIGWSNIIDEIKIIEKYLKRNYIHLALDPEYATKNQKIIPGKAIGSVSGKEINAVQQYLEQILDPTTDYNKMLMIHRFNEFMINDETDIIDYPNIEISIDMDGFGNKEAKKMNYEIFALKSYSEVPAIKLFYDWDTPIFTNEELMGFPDPPNIIIYQ